MFLEEVGGTAWCVLGTKMVDDIQEIEGESRGKQCYKYRDE